MWILFWKGMYEFKFYFFLKNLDGFGLKRLLNVDYNNLLIYFWFFLGYF